jgi:WD40 repeat protein
VLLSRDGRPIGEPIDLHGLSPHAVAFSADGRTIAVAGEVGQPGYGTVATVDVHSRDRKALTLPLWAEAKFPPFLAVAMRDDEHYVVGGSDGKLIEMSGYERPSPRPSSGFDIRSIAYSPDGRLLLAGDSVGVLACYRVGDGGLPRGKLDLARSVDGLAVAPDGTVAAGTADNDVFVFRAALHDSHARDACLPSNWPRSELRAHTEPVTSVTFGLNSKLLVSASNDGTLALWDLDRSRLLGRLEVVATEGSPGFAAIDGSGRVIVAASRETALRFPLERGTLRRRLCGIAGRSLTRDERKVFLPDQQYAGVGKCGTS